MRRMEERKLNQIMIVLPINRFLVKGFLKMLFLRILIGSMLLVKKEMSEEADRSEVFIKILQQQE